MNVSLPIISFLQPFLLGYQTALILATVVALILRIILAFAVYLNARRQIIQKRGLFLCGPAIWGFAVLVTGLVGVAIYWAIHHSTLRPGRAADSTE